MTEEFRSLTAPTYLDNEFRQVFRNLFYPDRVGGIDVDGWVKYCKQAGATLVYMDIKTQAFALYNTKLIPKDPVIGKRDMAAELARAANKYDIKWGVYIPPSTIESLLLGHDDWQQLTADGSPESDNWGWWRTVFCYNSGFQHHFAKMLSEIARKYRPHAFYVDDLIFGFSACFCKTCKEKFKKETGRKMPLAPDWSSPLWFTYLDWRYRQLEAVARLVHDAVHSVDPKIAVVWNFKAQCSGWYSGQNLQGRWLDYPSFEYLPTGWWGDFKDKFTYGEEMAFGITAHRGFKGGRLNQYYTYLVPETRQAEAELSYDMGLAAGTLPCCQEHCRFLPELMRRTKQAEPYLVDMTPAADVALHFSESAHNAYYRPNFGADEPFYTECRGVFKGLLNNHIPADIIVDEWIETLPLSRFRTVILPNSVYLSETASQRLSDYVRDGGSLIASLETGLRDQRGVRTGSELLWPGSGLRFKDEIVTTKAVSCSVPADGMPIIEPDIPADPDQFLMLPGGSKGWIGEDISLGRRPDGAERREIQQFAGEPSCHLPTTAVEVAADEHWKTLLRMRFRRDKDEGWLECPAVLRRKHGKGTITYVNFQIGTLVARNAHPWWRALLRKIVTETSGRGHIQVKAPVCLKMFLWRQEEKKRYVIHLVNELSSTGMRAVQREDRIPVPAKLRISLPGVRSVRKVLGASKCEIKRDGKGWTVNLAGVSDRVILVCTG